MLSLESKIEAVLLFKNEPISIKDLSKWLDQSPANIKDAVTSLQKTYNQRGMLIVQDGEVFSLGTHPDASALIENLQKEELSRELGRAGLETLAIILYRGPISRREIDHIRGVNSGFILRALLIRGLIERSEGAAGERSFSYKGTLKLLEYLGVPRQEDLPEYGQALKKIEEFVENSSNQENIEDNESR